MRKKWAKKEEEIRAEKLKITDLKEKQSRAGEQKTVLLFCSVLFCSVLFCSVLLCTVLYYTALHCTVLYCTACQSVFLPIL